MIYRRFGFLFSRLLLHKQDELAALEELLCSMDDVDDRNDRTKKYLRDRFADEARKDIPWPQSRKEVLEEIEKKVLEYSMSPYGFFSSTHAPVHIVCGYPHGVI